MIKQAAHRLDNLPLEESKSDNPPFFYCIDEPAGNELTIPHINACRFTGWMASTTGKAMKISAKIEGQPEQIFEATQERPDVVAFLENEGNKVNMNCGFHFNVKLPDNMGDALTLLLEFNDGEYFSSEEITIKRFSSLQWEPRKSEEKKDRSQYKDVWNEVSKDVDEAKVSVAGYSSEEEFNRSANLKLGVLKDTVGVKNSDTILEIGCGVGRMGPVLAPICKKWIGTDVSENMIEYARNRLNNFNNIELIAVNGWDLAQIPDASVDLVYCTVVFMHLDEWDRFNYVCEAKRILKPGGRLFIDNYNLLSDIGWEFFIKNMMDYHPLDRPSNISKSSTPSELIAYLSRAGLINIQSKEEGMWIFAWAEKNI